MLTVGVSLAPFDGGVESVHDGMYLETGGIVHTLDRRQQYAQRYETEAELKQEAGPQRQELPHWR